MAEMPEAVITTRSDDHYKIGFFVLVILLVGFIAGLLFAEHFIINPNLTKATRTGSTLINDKVYILQEVVGK